MWERDPAQFLPWMCAGLVLSVEYCMKGPATAIVVGASSLGLFAFVLVALNFYRSVEDESADELTPIIELRRNDIVLADARTPPTTFHTTPRTQDSR